MLLDTSSKGCCQNEEEVLSGLIPLRGTRQQACSLSVRPGGLKRNQAHIQWFMCEAVNIVYGGAMLNCTTQSTCPPKRKLWFWVTRGWLFNLYQQMGMLVALFQNRYQSVCSNYRASLVRSIQRRGENGQLDTLVGLVSSLFWLCPTLFTCSIGIPQIWVLVTGYKVCLQPLLVLGPHCQQ